MDRGGFDSRTTGRRDHCSGANNNNNSSSTGCGRPSVTPPPPAGESQPLPQEPRHELPPLRVALDVRFWGMSGLGTYVRELLAGFARMRLPVHWTLIGDEEMRSQIPGNLYVENWIGFYAPIYSAGSFLRYPSLRGVDLFHYPHYNLPLTRAPQKLVSVFDLFHLKYGSWGKRRYQRFFMKRLRWSRAHILTASDKTRQEVIRAAKLPLDRVSMLPLGPGRLVRGERPAAPELTSLAGTPIRPPWLLVTGIDQPHKNFDFLLSAIGLYYQRRPDAPPLVWSGLSPEARTRRARLLTANVRQHVALEPYAGGDQVEELFSGAGALIFPSLDEGFGFPPLEAMVRGVPVICSRCEPMLTILGNAPLYFEPTESASLWRMIDRILDSREIWEDVAQRGRQQAQRYRWDLTAKATYRLYEKICGRPATKDPGGR